MKALSTAALVIGAVAIASTGIGLAAGASLAGAFGSTVAMGAAATGIGASTFGAVLAGSALFTLSTVAQAVMPRPSEGGSQTKWKADPYAGLPYPMGRTLVSGNIVYRRGHGGENNKYQTIVTVLALTRAASIDATFANRTTVSFDGAGNAIGTYRNLIYQRHQLGRCPEPTALVPPLGAPPGWTPQHKLSGLPAVMNTLVYDNKGKGQLTTEPKMGWIGHWALVWDPVQDDTYPGGSGPCRALQEETYVWSDDPHLHALTWCLGRWMNGKRVAGIGAPLAQIDVAAFVEGRNLNKVRGWTLGGQVVTRPDTAWNSMKAMLQAGGAKPVITGGQFSCINQAPRVSLATITAADIRGKSTFSGTQMRRNRINGVIPSYRSEAHDWEMVPAKVVRIAEAVALDGDERTREIAFPLVQDVDQVAQLAAYEILDAREAGPGSIPLGPWWLNYKLGDCVTFQPEPGWSTKVMITGRGIEPASGVVTYEVRTETDSKHPYALGQTGVAPPTANIVYDPSAAAPAVGDWSVAGVSLGTAGAATPALRISGAVNNASADAVIFEYRQFTGGAADGGWIMAGTDQPTTTVREIAGIAPEAGYEVAISYRVRGNVSERLVLGPVTSGNLSTPAAPRSSHTIRSIDVGPAYPASSSADTITVQPFTATIDDGRQIAFPGAVLGGLAPASGYRLVYSIANQIWAAVPLPATAETASPAFVVLFYDLATQAADGTYPEQPTAPGGYIKQDMGR
ncbi:phage tail protein [Sphingomonas sp. 3-13AW]|uniref:phage tail protein n=1 Tax=Sphingomonas sp. 3-13AW TaxID=3050450 RepID=UPI003BB50BCB